MIPATLLHIFIASDIIILLVMSVLDIIFVELPPIVLAVLTAPLAVYFYMASPLQLVLMLLMLGTAAIMHKSIGYLDFPLLARVGFVVGAAVTSGLSGIVLLLAGVVLATVYVAVFVYLVKHMWLCGGSVTGVVSVVREAFLKPYFFPEEILRLGVESMNIDEINRVKKIMLEREPGRKCFEAKLLLPVIPAYTIICLPFLVSILLSPV